MIDDCHFEILGVTRQSTAAEIKKAYHRQIKKWHPDKFQQQPGKLAEAVARSKQINQAFRHLKNYVPPMSSGTKKKEEFGDSKSSSKRTGKPVFHRVKVNSSRIWSIGYDAFTKILEVEYYEEGVYHYYDIPEMIYTQLMFADPVDEYLDKHIASEYLSKHI